MQSINRADYNILFRPGTRKCRHRLFPCTISLRPKPWFETMDTHDTPNFINFWVLVHRIKTRAILETLKKVIKKYPSSSHIDSPAGKIFRSRRRKIRWIPALIFYLNAVLLPEKADFSVRNKTSQSIIFTTARVTSSSCLADPRKSFNDAMMA
jgi:hypothetical protein